MIKIDRGDEPTALIKNKANWDRNLSEAQLNLQRLESTSANKSQISQAKRQVKNAQGKYGHAEIRKELETIFFGKCAYCECQIEVGRIDHFRPKGWTEFAHLTFEWTNLIWSCETCNNRSHKGDKFPVDTSTNLPLLIDPSDPTVNIESHLSFHWDDDAEIAGIYHRDRKGEKTIEVFDLNGIRGRKLIKHRSEYLRKLMCILESAKQGNDRAISIIERAADPQEPYQAFVRRYVLPGFRKENS